MTDQEMIGLRERSAQLDRLRAIMHRLRAPGGCPWDAEQTHQSLISNLLEEAYEAVDAIQRSDAADLCEELGDLLLQVVFHSELAQEVGSFTLDDVAQGIADKLVRRHPHVFATSKVHSSDEVLTQWDQIKREERSEQGRAYLHGVGKGLPAMLRATKLQNKAAKVGFDWPSEAGVIEKLHEELVEVTAAIESDATEAIEEELGDLMFAVVNLIRYRKLDPEALMARANAKFEQRFAAMAAELSDEGLSLEAASLDAMERAWLRAKQRERKA